MALPESGLESEHAMDALEVRHDIQREISARGLKVTGGGMGFGGMDISLSCQDAAVSKVVAIVTSIFKAYGLSPEVQIDDDMVSV